MTESPHEKIEHPFYGRDIFVDREQEYVQNLLKKYKNEAPTEELKKKIWEELQMERYHGRLNTPFKIVTRKDPAGKFPSYIEIILDTKV